MSLYFSKLILFGEYIIIKGFSALAVPLPLYKGSWAIDVAEKKSNLVLKKIILHLQTIGAGAWLDLEKLEKDIDNGLFFNSDIPIGYGLGSSGALCAALYDVYKKKPEFELAKIKSNLGLIENYWHGQSSGLDPLICYLGKAVRVQRDIVELSEFPIQSKSDAVVFLLDTNKERQTSGLVNYFLENCKSEDFQAKCLFPLAAATELCIDAYLRSNIEQLWANLSIVSSLQLEYFERMIPVEFREIWRTGLITNSFYLKLCGAGGGGFILGFTKNWSSVQQQYLADYKTQVAFYF